jgi:hypothetical protein
VKFPKPWHRKGRGWFVTIDGKQVKLGKNKDEALEVYHRLMADPKKPTQTVVCSDSMLAIIDAFLEWVEPLQRYLPPRGRPPFTLELFTSWHLSRYSKVSPSDCLPHGKQAPRGGEG